MALTKTLRAPGTTLGSNVVYGDHTLDLSTTTGYWTWNESDTPDGWTGDYCIVFTGMTRSNSDNYSFGWYTDSNNRIQLRFDRSIDSERVTFAYGRGGSFKPVSLLKTNLESGWGRSNVHRILVWSDIGNNTLHIAALNEDGTLVENSTTIASGDHLDNIRGDFYIGSRDNGVTTLGSQLVSDLMLGHCPTNPLNLTDDEKIAVLRDPTLLGIHSEVEELWCPLGHLVLASDGSRVYNADWVSLDGTYRLYCPHQDATSQAFTGTGIGRDYYSVPEREGQASGPGDYAPGFEISETDSTKIVETCVGIGSFADTPSQQRATFFYTIRDATTMRRLKTPIPIEPKRDNGTTQLFGFNIQATDTHLGISVNEINGKLVFYPSGHHVALSGYEDVAQFIIIEDDQGLPTYVIPSLGGATAANRSVSYLNVLKMGDHLIVDTNESDGTARQWLMLKFDSTDNSVDYQFITTTPSIAGDGFRVGFPNNLRALDDDKFIAIRRTFLTNGGGIGVQAIIGSVSNFNTNTEWFLPGGGVVPDGVDGRPTLGSIDPGDNDLFVTRDHIGVLNSAADKFDSCLAMHFKNSKLSIFAGIDPNDADVDGNNNFTSWTLRTYTLSDSNVFSKTVERDVTTEVENLDSRLSGKAIGHIAQMYELDGKDGFLLAVLEPTADITLGTDGVFDESLWGHVVRIMPINDPTSAISTSDFDASDVFDVADSDGDSARMGATHGKLINNHMFIQMHVNPGGTTTKGAVTPVPIDLSSFVEAIPDSSSSEEVTREVYKYISMIKAVSNPNSLRSVARNPGSQYSKRLVKTDTSSILLNESVRLNQDKSSFVWSSGDLISDSGNSIYTSASGGYLSDIRISNKGNETVFYNFDSTTPSVSGDFSILPGETFTYSGPINNISAISNNGSGSLEIIAVRE